MAPHHRWPLVAERIRESRIPNSDDLLDRATRMDFENYLAEDILVKVDRASMLNSLEVRAPLLDYRIIEFAFGRVPDRLRATSTERKILLKMLARRLLPAALDIQRKQGFSLPLNRWFKGEWGDYLRDVLRGAPSRTAVWNAVPVRRAHAIRRCFTGESATLSLAVRKAFSYSRGTLAIRLGRERTIASATVRVSGTYVLRAPDPSTTYVQALSSAWLSGRKHRELSNVVMSK